jgi:hypothetical protein
MAYNAAEQETINLCICLEAIDNMANHELLMLRDVSEYPGEAEAIFKGSVHRDLFLIRLLDFAKEPSKKAGSCLAVLKETCTTKCFDSAGSVNDLMIAVEALESWLNQQKAMKLWLPTLNIEATISVSRLKFLHIIGNQSKHNLFRLNDVTRKVAEVLNEHGHSVPDEKIRLALDDFREHLAENYFIYYSTWLAELLNNVRWGIQTYLSPTFERSYNAASQDSFSYRYEYPDAIREEIPRQWFWRLMNNVRTRPYLKRFVCLRYLKKESSLESDRGEG